MEKVKCKDCGKELSKLSDYGRYPGRQCRSCYNSYCRKRKEKHREYMREWIRTKRWLDGGPDNHLLGEKLKISTIVFKNDSLHAYIDNEKLF
jgi:hypothetical protein